MWTWLRRIRGLAGLGAIGALVGGALAGGVTAFSTFRAWGTVPVFNLLTGMAFGAFFGLATTTGLGVLLALTSRGRRLEELSVRRAMAMSATVAVLVPVGLITLAQGGLPPLTTVISQILVFGGFGAALGGGLIRVAKSARLKELERGDALPESIE